MQFCSADFETLGVNFCESLNQLLDSESSALKEAKFAVREMYPSKYKGSLDAAGFTAANSVLGMVAPSVGKRGKKKKFQKKK